VPQKIRFIDLALKNRSREAGKNVFNVTDEKLTNNYLQQIRVLLGNRTKSLINHRCLLHAKKKCYLSNSRLTNNIAFDV